MIGAGIAVVLAAWLALFPGAEAVRAGMPDGSSIERKESNAGVFPARREGPDPGSHAADRRIEAERPVPGGDATDRGVGSSGKGTDYMPDIVRVPVEDARARVSRGDALLVCAYDDPSRFRETHLEGAISLEEFRAMAPTLDRAREIIFYCS